MKRRRNTLYRVNFRVYKHNVLYRIYDNLATSKRELKRFLKPLIRSYEMYDYSIRICTVRELPKEMPRDEKRSTEGSR